MQLHFLGTGAGMPSKERNTSACLLELYDERGSAWLFDCGEATQHQILKTTIKPRKVEKIFITHLHGDHIFGLPGFISSRSFLGGEEPLTIYGPKGIKLWLETTFTISQSHIKYKLIIEEIEEGIIFEDETFIVEAAPLEHVIPCFGYRITQKHLPGELLVERALQLGVPKGPLLGMLKKGENVTLEDGTVIYSEEVVSSPKKGKVIAYLGDTKYCQNSIELSKDANVIVHEATFDATTKQLAADYGHATNTEAATVAMQANAQALIINHISARFLAKDLDVLVQQAKEIFPNTYIANDFSVFPLNQL
jgi:ribonuclease Z